jgi:hypothetical protein
LPQTLEQFQPSQNASMTLLVRHSEKYGYLKRLQPQHDEHAQQ